MESHEQLFIRPEPAACEFRIVPCLESLVFQQHHVRPGATNRALQWKHSPQPRARSEAREELIRQVARDLYREIPGSIYNGTTRKFKLIPSEAKRVSTTKSPTKSWPSPGDSRGDLKVGSEEAAELP